MARYDDPVDAALERVEADASADDQFLGIANSYKNTAKKLVQGLFTLIMKPSLATTSVALTDIVKAWSEDSAKWTIDNQAYILSAVIQKLKLLDSAKLSDEARVGRLEEILGETIAYIGPNMKQERLDNLASIVVSGSMVFINDPIEQTDEFLRITSILRGTDIKALSALNKSQRSISVYEEPVESDVGRSDNSARQQSERLNTHRTKLFGTWPAVESEVRSNGISETSFQSALVRLQALGLVEPIVGGFDAGKPGYEVLELGKLYLDYLSDHHQTISQSEEV